MKMTKLHKINGLKKEETKIHFIQCGPRKHPLVSEHYVPGSSDEASVESVKPSDRGTSLELCTLSQKN